MRKTTILLVLLFQAVIAIAGTAVKCTFSLASPTTIGTTELKSGGYSLRVEGAAAVVVSAETGKSLTVPVKLETLETKFGGDTRVDTVSKGGKSIVDSILVGHSKTKIVIAN